MASEVQTKNVLMVALGGSGRNTAVHVSRKYSNSNKGLLSASQLNLKVVSIDFLPVQGPGYVVNQEDYVPLIFNGMNLIQCWEEFEKERKIMTEKEEAWMGVGPITESELWLARDAQQSGIRRVDYFLLIHLARKRIEEKLRAELLKLVELSGPDSKIEVIIVGSLVGRTGSISYVPILKIFETLSPEFNFFSSHSFLYMRQAFDMRLMPENDLNFFRSLASVHNHFKSGESKKFNPSQILINESCPLLSMNEDTIRALPFIEDIHQIELVIETEVRETSKTNGKANLTPSFQSIDKTFIDHMAEEFRQIHSSRGDSEYSLPRDWDTSKFVKVFANLISNE